MKYASHLFAMIVLATFALGSSFPVPAEENAMRLLVKWKDGPASPGEQSPNL